MNKLEIGIHKDLDIELYHRSQGISSTGLKVLLESPAKYYYQYLSGLHTDKDKKSLTIGSAVHVIALEPGQFDKKFHLLPEGFTLHSNANKKLYNDIKSSGKTPIRDTEFREASSIAFAIRSNKAFKNLIQTNGNIEDSLCWYHDDVLLRARPDFYNEFMVVDIKTTESVKYDDFQKTIINYGYHIQAAMQVDGLTALTGFEYKNFCLLAVEKEPPYLNAIYLLPQDVIEIGRKIYKKGALLYKQCLENNDWPGYPEIVTPINLPQWYINKINEEAA